LASVSSGNGLAFWRLILLGVVFAAVAIDEVGAAPFDEATEQYRRFMIADMDQALAGARVLRDQVNASDIAAAKKAWIEARIGWERSEVFTAGFIPELDDAIDAWPDAVTGFHGIEVKLFGASREDDLSDELNQLILHLTEADDRIRNMELTPQGLLNGITRLAFEIGDSKVDGGESRWSGTSLDDMRNNADGIKLAYRTVFALPLQASDPKLAEQLRNDIEEITGLLKVEDLRRIDPAKLQKASEVLVVALQAAGPKLGLATPTLEGPAK
jgi:iron uptake system component EfeO